LELNKDFVRLLRALADVDARYLLVGAHAVDFYGQARTTRHMDIWLDDGPDNLECVYRALASFGAPALAVEHLSAASPLEVVWIGVPPDRIDLVKGMRGLNFADAWLRRTTTKVDEVSVPIIGRNDLIAAKRATEREKDLADAEALVAQRPGERESHRSLLIGPSGGSTLPALCRPIVCRRWPSPPPDFWTDSTGLPARPIPALSGPRGQSARAV
jgi:hypothetical protein